MKKNNLKDNRLQYRCIQVYCIVFLLLTFQVSYADIKEKNWSVGKPAKQSSVAFGAAASRAVDGNRNGNFNAGSVTHTSAQLKPYWQVDLGAVVPVDFIRIFNRTDCCKERLSNVFIFISDTPFIHNDAADVLQEPGVNFSVIWNQAGDQGRDGSRLTFHTVRFQQRAYGRYIRIQLAGRGMLSLAEVEVIQQENIQGPSLINDATTWVPTGVNIRQGDFTSIDVNGEIATFQCGADGLLHYTLDFENDEVINGSPQISLQAAPAAVWDKTNDIIHVAVVTTSGEFQIGSGKKQRIGFLSSRPWTWATVGRSAKGGDLAINCNKVIAAWLDGNRIKSSFKILNEDNWSAPFDVSEGACAPSLASSMVSSSGDFGMAFLRSNGIICFTRARCSAGLDWGGIENPTGLAFGERVGIAAYGDYFALATMGGDNRPYFSLQVDGPNGGLPVWPGFEPVRAVSFEESKIMEAPRLIIFRGMIFVLARDNTKALRSWLRFPNHLGLQSGIGWCGGSIVGGGGTSAVSPRLVSIGRLELYELMNVPAELYLITSGINDRQLYALNFGRSVSLDLLDNFFHLDLSPNPGNGLDLKTVGNLPEHVMSLISLPDDAWQGVIGKKCNSLTLATSVHLHPLVTGQARPGQCPMELFLNGADQSARFMLHEWMHIDFSQRKIGNLPGFNEAFGDPKPKLCDGNNCGGDQCMLADQFTQFFNDPTITRWAGRRVCVDNGRPQGGVDFYEFQSAEHAFIETATRYRFHGDELRFLANRDLQRGNPQLKKRYDWIKLRYYGGQEFNGWSSSGITANPAIDAGDRTRGFIGRPLR